jgi:hypothetical protein
VRRLALVLAATAAMTVPMLVTAGAASADPLEPLRVINVWVNSHGDVCVTYKNLTTVCTNL